MFDHEIARVGMPERESRARHVVRAAERAHGGRDEGRFPGAEVARKRDDVTCAQRTREAGRKTLECRRIEIARDLRSHKELDLGSANADAMWWRANDVLVGIITGVFSAVVAALFEAFFVSQRFLSFGHYGGAVGSKLAVIAVIGAVVGGVVGFLVGTVIKPRSQPR